MTSRHTCMLGLLLGPIYFGCSNGPSNVSAPGVTDTTVGSNGSTATSSNDGATGTATTASGATAAGATTSGTTTPGTTTGSTETAGVVGAAGAAATDMGSVSTTSGGAGTAAGNLGNGGTSNAALGSGGTANDAAVANTGGSAAPASEATCSITSSAEISPAIATVGIVTFSTDMPAIDSARIEFGLDTSYGMTAPVDLAEPENRTLILGMKQNHEYHFRIVVSSGGTECTDADQTIMTGPLPNVLPILDVTNFNREALAGGFFQTGQYQAGGGNTSPAYIIDADGDYVWAVEVGDYVTGVRQSYDGKYMWINGTDNTTAGAANIHRVSMDGLIDEDLSAQFGIQDHAITVLPDESVIFFGHESECADIKRRYPDGTIVPIINSRDAHGAAGPCHINAIEYSPEDETLIFSDDNHDNYTKITLDGQVVWVLGGETNQFTGDGATWNREHGVDVLGINRLLYFNNGEMRADTGSMAHELVLDLDAMTATRVWTYTADPPISNQQLGDVQRMANGNTVIAYSVQGLLHEVDADGNLLQEISWPLGGAFGYMNKRATLYGPPPR